MRARPVAAAREAQRAARRARARLGAPAGRPALTHAPRCAGLPVTAETCPHYLTFAGEDVPAGATAFKCAPPLRGAANREALWAALAGGGLDSVASDHSPAPPALKLAGEGDFVRAWGGIAGALSGWVRVRGRLVPACPVSGSAISAAGGCSPAA